MTHSLQEISKAFMHIEGFILLKKGQGLKEHLRHHINQFIKKNQKFAKRVDEIFITQEEDIRFLKNKEVRGVIKQIEKELHTTYSQFLSTNKSKRENALKNAKDISSLLHFHKSTQERIETYKNVYSKIIEFYYENYENRKIEDNKLTSKDTQHINILDVACGMNPLSIKLFNSALLSKNNAFILLNWIGTDVNEEDMEYLSRAYKEFNFKGEFLTLDMTLTKSLEILESKKVDILFVFKALDSFEYFKRNISYYLLEKLQFTIGVISFATHTLGGRKKIPITKRAWLFKFLEKNTFKYRTYETDNEIYIMFKKST